MSAQTSNPNSGPTCDARTNAFSECRDPASYRVAALDREIYSCKTHIISAVQALVYVNAHVEIDRL